MFERMEISGSIYKGVLEPFYEKLPGQIPTMMVTSGTREENPLRHGLAPIKVRALASAENDT